MALRLTSEQPPSSAAAQPPLSLSLEDVETSARGISPTSDSARRSPLDHVIRRGSGPGGALDPLPSSPHDLSRCSSSTDEGRNSCDSSGSMPLPMGSSGTTSPLKPGSCSCGSWSADPVLAEAVLESEPTAMAEPRNWRRALGAPHGPEAGGARSVWVPAIPIKGGSDDCLTDEEDIDIDLERNDARPAGGVPGDESVRDTGGSLLWVGALSGFMEALDPGDVYEHTVQVGAGVSGAHSISAEVSARTSDDSTNHVLAMVQFDMYI